MARKRKKGTMSKGRYSEEEAVQKPAGELLRKMGWELVYAYNDEELGAYGTLGRKSYHEVVLRRYLVDAIVELNEWLEPEECEQAADALMATLATDTLLQTNEKKYAMLRDGIPVEKRRADGAKYTEYAQVFDFERPEYNRFIAVEEMWVEGPLYKRRPDLMGFVNGMIDVRLRRALINAGFRTLTQVIPCPIAFSNRQAGKDAPDYRRCIRIPIEPGRVAVRPPYGRRPSVCLRHLRLRVPLRHTRRLHGQ